MFVHPGTSFSSVPFLCNFSATGSICQLDAVLFWGKRVAEARELGHIFDDVGSGHRVHYQPFLLDVSASFSYPKREVGAISSRDLICPVCFRFLEVS